MVVAAKRAARRDGVRVFKRFSWLEVGSIKVALSRPTHQRVPRRKHAGQAASRWAAPFFGEDALQYGCMLLLPLGECPAVRARFGRSPRH